MFNQVSTNEKEAPSPTPDAPAFPVGPQGSLAAPSPQEDSYAKDGYDRCDGQDHAHDPQDRAIAL